MAAIRSLHSTNPEVAEKIRTEADYFQTNTERMRYPNLRRQHLFVGSGVIELQAAIPAAIHASVFQNGEPPNLPGLIGAHHRLLGPLAAPERPANVMGNSFRVVVRFGPETGADKEIIEKELPPGANINVGKALPRESCFGNCGALA